MEPQVEVTQNPHCESGTSPTATIETEDRLAAFRQQVKAEDESRPRMSDAAAARLRQINEHDRIAKAANATFSDWFAQQTVTVEFLMDSMFRFTRGDSSEVGVERHEQRRKRAIKCAHMFQHRGHTTITEPHDLMFLGELLPEEREMSTAQIMRRYPVDEDRPIYTQKPVAPVVKNVRVALCASGSKCIWVKRGKAAPAVGRSKYCTPVCQKADAARQRRPKTTRPAQNVREALSAPA